MAEPLLCAPCATLPPVPGRDGRAAVTMFAGWALCELCLANAMRDPVALAYGVGWFIDRTQQLARGMP